jgi:hypothetical protein
MGYRAHVLSQIVIGKLSKKLLPLPSSLSTQILPAVMLDDLFADGQTEAGTFGFAGLVVFDLLEAFEDFVELVGGDARAGVGD